MNILWGFGGILTVFSIGYLFSYNRKKIKLRPVLGGLAIQLTFAFIVLYTEWGKDFLKALTDGVNNITAYANTGIQFLLGNLADEKFQHIGTIFAFHILPVIIFFSALISVLYYLKIMQVVIRFIGGGLAKLLGTTRPESLSAAANIFVGQTEAPLVVKPYLEKLTTSELFAVMTGGVASVAGSVLIGYSLLGIPLKYLLAASFMAAPAGLVMAKILYPQVEEPVAFDDFHIEADPGVVNVFDAAAQGAATGLKLAANIGAMLMAYIALIALVNGILGGIGSWIGIPNLSLELILGYIFSPVAMAIGVYPHEAVQAGNFIGQKVIINEFVAYGNLGKVISTLTPKTQAILSFALCGFANVSSIAIQIGGLGSLAPSRRHDIARLGMRAVLAGVLASLLSASIAGMFVG
ncbi:MAG: NupC/NupG family nucleoside CNT transporter [Candidatus Hydrogenedentota bacterium]|nr:MAG: NupC/NupG family nucleoside CNT transporter [Candidatus Hydrogenedentota bacterium]